MFIVDLTSAFMCCLCVCRFVLSNRVCGLVCVGYSAVHAVSMIIITVSAGTCLAYWSEEGCACTLVH